MTKRIPQVNSLLEFEISQIIQRRLDLSRDCLVTITAVETSADLREAKVWVSALPVKTMGRVLRELNRKKGEIQKILFKKLFMKPLPKIIFKADKTEEQADKIETLLKKLES